MEAIKHKIKCCPDLTTIEWKKAMLRGNGDFQCVVLNGCIENECAAFKDGRCMKYNNDVYIKN